MFRLTEHLMNVLTSWDGLFLLGVVALVATTGVVRRARQSGGHR